MIREIESVEDEYALNRVRLRREFNHILKN